MKLTRLIISVIVAGFTATSALGSITLIAPVVVDNSSGGAELDGFITNDLTINSTTDWTEAAILLELTSGSIFQHPNGDARGLEPLAVLLDNPAFPALRYDTFVTNPDGTEVGGGASIANCATGIGCPPFDSSQLDIIWKSPGADEDDIGEIVIGRITLSHDAQGSMTLGLRESGSATWTVFENVPIVNGVIGVPEPASLVLLGLGGLAVLRRR